MTPVVLNKQLKRARELMSAGQFARALSLYAELPGKFPNGRGEYGSAAAQSGDFELANRLWNQLESQVSGDAAALGWIANECSKVGMNAMCRSFWIKAARADPRNLLLQLQCAG